MKDDVASIYYLNNKGYGIKKGSLSHLEISGKRTEDKDKIATHILWSFTCGSNRGSAGRAMETGDYIEFNDGEIWVCSTEYHRATDVSPARTSISWEIK
jgi:hypothetical protein